MLSLFLSWKLSSFSMTKIFLFIYLPLILRTVAGIYPISAKTVIPNMIIVCKILPHISKKSINHSIRFDYFFFFVNYLSFLCVISCLSKIIFKITHLKFLWSNLIHPQNGLPTGKNMRISKICMWFKQILQIISEL